MQISHYRWSQYLLENITSDLFKQSNKKNRYKQKKIGTKYCTKEEISFNWIWIINSHQYLTYYRNADQLNKKKNISNFQNIIIILLIFHLSTIYHTSITLHMI